MVTSNFLHRVFRIRYRGSTGTAFAIDVDGRQYLVTAQHIVSSLFVEEQIDIFENEEWNTMAVRLVGHASNPIDISVLVLDRLVAPTDLCVQVSNAGIMYGQDVHFLGFPYNWLGSVIFTDRGYPLPFVKRATVSQFGNDKFFLDGHNNPGFSGGPVIFGQPFEMPTHIGAIISGYKWMREPIYKDGDMTDMSYRYNTGIIIAYRIEYALDLIRANPIGIVIH